MAISRYSKNDVIRTSKRDLNNIVEKRGVNYVDHYSFEKLKLLRVEDLNNITVLKHTWQSSDRFFKLADKYYNDPTYWWVIAYVNNKPLETDVAIGETLIVPVPIEYILAALEY